MTAAALPPPPTSRKARTTYQTLIEATREVLREHGALSPELISETAAVSPATFYTYFSSKDEALAAAFDQSLGEMHRTISETLAIEPLLEMGLEKVISNVIRTIVRGFAHDARLFRLAISRLPDSSLIRDVYREHEVEIVEFLERFIRLGISAGKLATPDPATAAKTILVTLEGLQNPLLQKPGSNGVTDQISRMVVNLLRA